MSETLRFMFLGDVVGKPGRAMCSKWIPRLITKHSIDAVIVNGENSADNGRGITKEVAEFFFSLGVAVITTGNHIWAHSKEIYTYINENRNLIRPANFPSACPGKGYALIEVKGHTVAIMNVQGRVFMHEQLDCPFRATESLLSFLKSKTSLIFLDFHAETTSEKQCMAYFVDGKVSGVYGTHTHVQTADEKILPGGTSYITDLGFSGALYSMLGMKKEEIMERFLTQMPHRFVVDTKGPMTMNGIVVEVDASSGKSKSIQRINFVDEEITHVS